MWLRRDQALDEAALTLDDVLPIDQALKRQLSSMGSVDRITEPGHVFAATVVGYDHGVLEAALSSEPMFRGLESALGWMRADELPLDALPTRAVIAGYAVHRLDPGPLLNRAIESEDPLLRARSIKAVWQIGRRDLIPAVRSSYTDLDVKCRFSACWAGALFGAEPEAIAGLQRFAESGERYPDRAVQLVCALMPPEDARAWVLTLPFWLQCLGMASIGLGEDVRWLTDRGVEEGVFTITGRSLGDLDEAHGEVREFLGKALTPGWLREVLRHGRMPHRHLAATELCLVSGEAPYEFRAPAYRQIRWLHDVQ